MSRTQRLKHAKRQMVVRLGEALTQTQEEEWRCASCGAPALEDCNLCMSCKHYWQDVENGLFNHLGDW